MIKRLTIVEQTYEEAMRQACSGEYPVGRIVQVKHVESGHICRIQVTEEHLKGI